MQRNTELNCSVVTFILYSAIICVEEMLTSNLLILANHWLAFEEAKKERLKSYYLKV